MKEIDKIAAFVSSNGLSREGQDISDTVINLLKCGLKNEEMLVGLVRSGDIGRITKYLDKHGFRLENEKLADSVIRLLEAGWKAEEKYLDLVSSGCLADKEEKDLLVAKVDKLGEEVDKLSEELTFSENKLTNCRKILNHYSNQIQKLISENNSLKAQNGQLTKDLKDTKYELETLKSDNDSLIGSLEVRDEEIEKLRDIIASYEVNALEEALNFDTKTSKTTVTTPTQKLGGQDFSVCFTIPRNSVEVLTEKINKLENRIVAVESCCGID